MRRLEIIEQGSLADEVVIAVDEGGVVVTHQVRGIEETFEALSIFPALVRRLDRA